MNTTTWYGATLRWIGSLFVGAADYFDRPAPEGGGKYLPMEDFASDMRIRIMTRYY